MYLKSLELVGFKSFANKTRLVFEPGMTAIVGPNGCGKSNVSDAIRWVLGEQRPKALRGSKMQDVIFSGTESRKPLGMAEVSITFADCETLLDTEFNEITVSRRVFRTGEGQYFINKAPCRLKDVQRLFMGTGIGTTSYSVMAQGQIDAVLSSRPEDRRAIFEEASGITKFKADKNEAIRKLDHTDANLLRLADVIREVKRQIGSLQRQAGKARRYKTLQAEMRTLDLFATRERLGRLEARIRELTGSESELSKMVESIQSEVEELEKRNAEGHEGLLDIERRIGTEQEHSVDAQAKHSRASESVRINTRRIEEYQRWTERDAKEAGETQEQITEQEANLESLEQRRTEAATELESASASLAECRKDFDSHQREIDSARACLQQLREKSVEQESHSSRTQNRFAEIETQERETVIQRERLSVEKSQLTRVTEQFKARETELAAKLKKTQKAARDEDTRLAAHEEKRKQLNAELRETVEKRSSLQSSAAAKEAQITLLEQAEKAEEAFPAGSRKLLDDPRELGAAANTILGPLADHITTESDLAPALQVVLRAWLDAVLIRTPDTALAALSAIRDASAGATRLLSVEGKSIRRALPKGAKRLLDAIKVEPAAEPVVSRLLANVALVESPEDFPSPVPAGCAYVTPDGALATADGGYEWWQPESQTSNPLGRRLVISDTRKELNRTQREIKALTEQRESTAAMIQALDEQIQAARSTRDDQRRALAQLEGENGSVQRDAKTAAKRLETVTWELDDLCERSAGTDEEKAKLAKTLTELRTSREKLAETIGMQSAELNKLEQRHIEVQSQLTEQRIHHASLNQRAQHLESEYKGLTTRINELKRQVKGRTQGIASYSSSIKELTAEIEEAQSGLPELEKRVIEVAAKLEALRKDRETQRTELARKEAQLAEKRRTLEQQRSRKNAIDIELTEARTHRQNRLDRVREEYKLTSEQLRAEPDPKWDNATVPPLQEVEQRVSELRSRLESMGPVNLVAIDEYKELEERYTFLVEQEQDLVKAKEQLLEMIRRINKTTSEMFRDTFVKANENFQKMFQKLFNGGTAKLVLVNEEDVLECGIDIIARPPGKRLQNVSLLSGGERTLTAVSLLFAIYEIKPSPFCLLDELDAALDDANIGRFVSTLREFLGQSQFIIITHNQHTIAGSDIVYGVTMPEKGVSRIVSMKLPTLLAKEAEPVKKEAEDGTEPPSPEEIAAIEAAEAEREEKRRKRREKRAAKKRQQEAEKAEQVSVSEKE